MNFEELNKLVERIVRKKVVRGGKKKILKKSNREGFTVDKETGREVKMSAQERLKLSKSQKKAAIKRKSGKGVANIKRKKSVKLRNF